MHSVRSPMAAAVAATLSLLLAACADPVPADGSLPTAPASAPPDAGAASADAAAAPSGDPSPAGADALPPDESFDTATAGVPDAALAVPPPDADAVLDAIFGTEGPGAAGSVDDGRALPDGRLAAFWRGQTFALDGAGWHVGFATTVESSDYPAPDDAVGIAQATWRFADGAWQPVSTADPIGRFGGRGRAPDADGAQDARVFDAGGGRVLLAMPTAVAANAGIVVHAYELFAGDGDPLAWRHVGRLPAGSDNRAGCSDAPGGPVPCASAAGTLEFIAAPASSPAPWPTLRLALQGTVVEGPGQVRETTADDVVELRFDAVSGQYQPVRPIPDAAR